MQATWDNVCDMLREVVGERQFDTWIRPIRPVRGHSGELLLEAPDVYLARYVSDNYLDAIRKALWKVERKHVGVRFRVAESGENGVETGQNGGQAQQGKEMDSPVLHAHFTFETFVVGESNKVAHSACEMAAARPGKVYNPVFVYGGIGVGKTHLVQAVAHRVLESRHGERVKYVSGEEYVNQVMNALRMNTMDALRYRYRGSCDVLIVDDIQYLCGKEFAQDEFYHTFNELYNANRQIILTGDRLPGAIPKIAERLRSRFDWGLTVDIQPPDRELRRAILLAKAGREGIELPSEAVEFLVDNFTSSVRELEGAMNRVAAHALIRQVPITLELARRVTEGMRRPRGKRVTRRQVLTAVADYFQLSPADLSSKGRSRLVSHARQVAIFILRRHTDASLSAIAEAVGRRSHTTVINALRHIERAMAREPALERAVSDIEQQLGLSR